MRKVRKARSRQRCNVVRKVRNRQRHNVVVREVRGLLSPGVFLVVCPHGVVLLYAFMTKLANNTLVAWDGIYDNVVAQDEQETLHRDMINVKDAFTSQGLGIKPINTKRNVFYVTPDRLAKLRNLSKQLQIIAAQGM